MKKLLIIAICVLQILVLSGCYDYMETEERAIVSGVFVEKADEYENEKYKITVEVVNTQSGGKEAQKPQIVNSKGMSIIDAIDGASALTGKKLYFGHTQLIVIDEAVARDGIRPICDFIARDIETRLSQQILISKNITSDQIFASKDEEKNIKAFDYSEMTQANESNAISAPVPAYVFIREWLSEGIDSIVPMLEMDNGMAKVLGTALFKDDKMVGELGEAHTKYLLFCKNLAKGGSFVLNRTDRSGGDIGFNIEKRSAKINTYQENGKISVKIDFNTQLNVSEIVKKQSILKPEEMQKLEAECELWLKNKIIDMLKIVQTNNGCDALGIGKQLFEKYPEMWELYGQKWDEIYKGVTFSVTVKCSINSSGRLATDLRKSEEWVPKIN